ncbi:MAG TPA: TlpA disulfide reductase family protein [Polyangiales bacterium]|nr:TlpA disulfide reductase family protein [Polyangiales bacterium]
MWNGHRRAALFACALAYVACDDIPARRAPEPVEAKAEPSVAPAAPAPNTDVKTVDAPALFAQMRSTGKRGTVVNIWASWCGSCKAEVPMLLQLRQAFAAENLDFVFVSADETPDFPKAAELMRSWSAPLPALAVGGSMGEFKRAMHVNWKGAIPATFLFDDTAKLRHYWEGPILEHEISPILQGFLAGEAIDGETRPPLAGEH